MSARLAGKTCLVTGAAQGIGRAVSDHLIAEGAAVVAADIADIPAAPGMTPVRMDVTDADSVRAAIAAHPAIDVLVNCAGFVAVGDATECSVDDLDRSCAVNMRSILLTAQAVLPGMIDRGGGVIVNIASVVSTTKAASRRFAYAATKAAVS